MSFLIFISSIALVECIIVMSLCKAASKETPIYNNKI
ncbi:hypothetical protein Clopa_2740 [Clostridium pasteurianum BC1]|uniref:Uncharacterized protein n=1 Tax=Clostridium pasteurianum BC1 TaxID=86416 RepID=R4K4T9_CLOPA|nr:hypothetical protein Clopa_2740 [Clostridium pasteurianum BC1]